MFEKVTMGRDLKSQVFCAVQFNICGECYAEVCTQGWRLGMIPLPGNQNFTVDDLSEACIELRLAGTPSVRPRSSVKPSEEQVRRREEHDHKSLMIALEV